MRATRRPGRGIQDVPEFAARGRPRLRNMLPRRRRRQAPPLGKYLSRQGEKILLRCFGRDATPRPSTEERNYAQVRGLLHHRRRAASARAGRDRGDRGMSALWGHHRQLTNGVGKCSVPMWMEGCPAGFCDAPAYGERPRSPEYRNAYGDRFRADGKYSGYVPGLACVGHGGPPPMHRFDPCIYCGSPHDEVKPGPCPRTLADAKP